MRYLPLTEADRSAMLETIGAPDVDALFSDVPEEAVAAEIEIYSAQAKASGKPENVVQMIAEGKLGKWFAEVVLLEQPFVKDPDKTIEQLVTEVSAKTGEKIEVSRFARFSIG